MASNLKYSRLGGSTATFESMIQHFGVVTVMNAKVYEPLPLATMEGMSAGAILKELAKETGEPAAPVYTPLCELKTLKIANATQEGPTKTITGGQYANPLIKYGKSMRLEMQDALGSAAALDALCGTVSEAESASGAVDYTKVHALHVTEDFNGPKTIVGDTFFIDQVTGQQVKAKIVFYQFLPDSIFNLTQDAEGDATVFDMNGDVLTTTITIKDLEGSDLKHGVFYSIVDPEEEKAQ